jgi:hypothetical protein
VPLSEGVAVLERGKGVWEQILTLTSGRVPAQPDEVAVMGNASFPVRQADGTWDRTSAHVGDVVHLTWLGEKRVVGTIRPAQLNGVSIGPSGVVDPSARSTIEAAVNSQIEARDREVWAVAGPGAPFDYGFSSRGWTALNGAYTSAPQGLRVPIISRLVGRWLHGPGYYQQPWLVRADGSWGFGTLSAIAVALIGGIGVLVAVGLAAVGSGRARTASPSSRARRTLNWIRRCLDGRLPRLALGVALTLSISIAALAVATLVFVHGHRWPWTTVRLTPSMLGPIFVGLAAYAAMLWVESSLLHPTAAPPPAAD